MQTFVILITCLAIIIIGLYIIAKIIISELNKDDKHIIQKNFEGGYLVFPKGCIVPLKLGTLEGAKVKVGELIYLEENKSIHNLAYDDNECVKMYLTSLKKLYDERV